MSPRPGGRSGQASRERGALVRGVLLALALFLHLAPLAAAQESTYRIGPKDVLKITVYGHEDLTRSVVVSDRGLLSFPLVGDVPAAGLTASQLETRLRDLLGKDYLVDPQVSVAVQEYRSQRVFVLGEAERPGTYALTGQATVLDILSQAGGPGKSAGRGLVVVRVPQSQGPVAPGAAGAATFQVNLKRLLAGEAAENLVLQNGDTVYLPKVTTFFVLGEVQRQGSFVMDKDTTVLEAVTLAGGFTDRAAPAGAKVLRKRADGSQETIEVDLSGVDPRARELLVGEGDTVFVPRGNTFFVSGEVRKPGAYQLDRPTTAFGAITLAGGFTEKAVQAQVKLIRRLPGGEEQTTLLDLSGADPQARDHPLKDADTLLVAPGNTFFVLGEVRRPGAYQLDRSATAFGAIALAGGFTEKAGQSQVKVIRRGAGGGEEQVVVDLSGADARGRELPLRDGDTVLVPPGNTYFVSGEVRRPGAYQLDRPTTAFGAITLAGGFTEKAGQTQVKLIRRAATGEEQLVLDLSGADPRARDHGLRDGDTLVVPSGNSVFVLGEVRRPGAYQLDKSNTAFGAVALAGGFTERAGQSQVKLIRRGAGGEEEQVVLDLSGTDPRARDYLLKDGDTLVVPSGNNVFVLGEVRRPGAYQLDQSSTAFGAVALAGGFTEKAGLSQVKLIRRGAGGAEEQILLDLSGTDARGRDFPLKDGDTLLVPLGNTFFVLGEVRRPGVYQLDKSITAFSAVALAGGFTEKAAQGQAKVIRRGPGGGEQTVVLDLSGVDQRAREFPLQDSDTLVVPTGNAYFVLGEVKRPGAYQLDRNSTAIAGITLAGGFTDKAAQTQVKLTRRTASGEEEQVVLDLSGTDPRARDYPLKDGDTLVVPSGNTFFVMGEVRRPGAYQLDRNTTAIAGITLAGGFTEKAGQTQVKLIRRSASGEEQLVLDLSGSDARARDQTLRDGDSLVVPTGNTFFVLGEVRRPGVYQLDRATTAFGAIALAGGFSEKAGPAQVKLTRRGAAGQEEQLLLDLSGTDPRAREFALQDGDTLVVPTGNIFFVLGEVRRPGAYQLDQNTTAIAGITLAGGFSEKAGQTQVKLIRRSATGEEGIVLDLSGTDPRARDYPLRDGDTVVVPTGNTFFVLGEVRRPGAYQLDRTTTAIAGVTLAGGFTEKAAQGQVKVTRRLASGEEQQVILDLSGTDPRAREYALRDGDTVIVPTGNTFFVLGEVKRPGAYQLDRNSTAIAGITLAGGFTEKAGQTQVKVTRRLASGEEQQVVLDLSGTDPRARDYPLREGDTLVVPTGNTFYVLGEVRKPGAYQLDQSTTTIQAIAMAGGFTDRAAPNRTRVIRTHRDGRQETLTVDLNDVIKRGRSEKDIPLLANDVIVVPESFF